MAIIIDDSCTDINTTHLENHTPETGTWSNLGGGGYAEILSNTVRCYPFGSAVTYRIEMSDYGDMFLEALKPIGTSFGSSSRYTLLLVRCSFSGSVKSGYGLKLLRGTTGSSFVLPSIVRLDADSETELATCAEFDGRDQVFKISIVGDTITAYKNDVEVLCTAVDNTYTTGKMGMHFHTPGESDIKYDDIYGETIESPTIYTYPFPCFNPAEFQV